MNLMTRIKITRKLINYYENRIDLLLSMFSNNNDGIVVMLVTTNPPTGHYALFINYYYYFHWKIMVYCEIYSIFVNGIDKYIIIRVSPNHQAPMIYVWFR